VTNVPTAPPAMIGERTRRRAYPVRSLLGAARRSPGAVFGALVIVAILLAGYFLPLPYDPYAPDTNATLQGPSSDHWFGTDSIGRDQLSRVIDAAQTDLPLALGGSLLAMLIGVPIGLIVSSKARSSEWAMRGIDLLQAFPLIILAATIVQLKGNRLSWVVIAIALIFAPLFIRLVRSEALAIRESRYIEAAGAIGASRKRIMFRHLLPNVTGIIMVQAAVTASNAVLLIAALSFLGIGITPPTASWGAMIQGGASLIAAGQWWIAVFPGLVVMLCVLCFNLIADSLESVFGRGARG
jgi:peptide/nickel transport system permease protein